MTAFRMLGELQVRITDRELDLGPPKQRAVLAALLIDADRVVPVHTLVDRVWNDDPPTEARNALYVHVTHIRRLLAHAAATANTPWRLVRSAGGYQLAVDRELVDLHRFQHLTERARDADCPPDTQASRLREALALWRGTPLSGLSGAWVERVREDCRQQRIEAMLGWARAELRLGQHDGVAAQVAAWVNEYPLVEPLTAVLMRALYATGRAAEALDRYAITRRLLIDELGVEPGADLRRLHGAILRGELDPPPAEPIRPEPVPPPAETVRPPVVAVPAQLPLGVRGFAGRTDELDRLHEALVFPDGQSTAAPIFALSGTAGVGKTSLAVHWAHQVADRFPDGQLYINLRGFDPTESPLPPSTAVGRFLEAFDLPPQRVPASLDARTALLRSMLAGRKMLMLLDNARDAEQVRPLLPGSPGCLVLVTSRNSLSSLVAAEGAQPLAVDLLSPPEARQLLSSRIGADRVLAEPAAVDELIEVCARLPLALAIVAAHAVLAPALPLDKLAAQLRGSLAGLDAFSGGDDATDVLAVFSWSYRALRPDAARLFRLLGLLPTPDIATPAVASLAGLPLPEVRTLLAELTDTHMLTEHAPGRYTFHDLLRVFAMDSARKTDPEADRRQASHRLLDHYLHTAHRATLVLYPQREAIALAAGQPGAAPEPVETEQAALAWFSAEHAALLAIVEQAAVTGFDTHVWQLAWALTTVFDRQGYWQDLITVQQLALDTGATADDAGRIHAHRGLARAYTRLGRYDDAYLHFQHALELSGQADEPVGAGNAHLNLGWVREHQSRFPEALDHGREALDVFRSVGHRPGQARALNAIGWNHALMGEYEQALGYCRQALDLNRELGNRHGEANTWDSLGYAHHRLHDHGQATECYQHAVELFREIGDRYEEAQTLVRVGDVHADADAADAAAGAWRAALTILRELDHADAARVQAKLAALDGGPR